MYACYKKYISYLSLTFLCESRVYLSMEICKKKSQMEYLLTFLIHDPHLAKWEDYVNNKMIFKWNLSCVLVKNPGGNRWLVKRFFLWCETCGWLASKMNDTRIKCLKATLEKRSCYSVCQWYSYLRFQVPLHLHFSSSLSPSAPALNEDRLLCLYIIRTC